MAERVQFRSIGNPEWAYAWYDRSLDYDLRRHGPYVADHAGMFMVYSDWPTQHSHESCVPADRFTDWINSLAAHLVATPEDAKAFIESWPRSNPDNEKIVLACKIKYREDKRQWYSLAEEKVSASESKRNDRRWEDVPSWADGSFKAVFGIVCHGYGDLIYRYQLAEDCKTVYRRVTGNSAGYDAAEKLVDVDYSAVMAAWRICRDLITAERLRDDAVRCWNRKTEDDAYNASIGAKEQVPA